MRWLFMVVCIAINLFAKNIENYNIVNKYFEDKDSIYIAIREFAIEDKWYYLAVDTNNLTTKIVEKKDIKYIKPISNRPLHQLYNQAMQNKTPIHNAGINQSYQKSDTQYLTIDMCPSSKMGYEVRLFEVLNQKPTKINIALSAMWAKKHKDDFETIKNYKNLQITWINHSYNHYYNKTLPLEQNFLLAKDLDIDSEIIENEKFMIANDIVPSVFIRFPGLVSDNKLVEKIVTKYSLLPLGSDAWIAKNEPIKQSSIILVHGNLNEPQGIDKLLKYDIENMNFGSINEISTNDLD